MPTKHLVVIHGRSTKPTEEVKRRLVTTALVAGLRRVDEAAARALEEGRVKMSFVYYGDINNRIMTGVEPERKRRMVEINGNWYVPPDSYEQSLSRLLARPTEQHTREEYRRLLDEVRDIEFGDDLARLASPVLKLVGLSRRVILKLFPDLGAYLTSRVIGSEIRQRLQKPLYEALLADEDVALVSHSMGCMVSYDVLWKFSRMSEYQEVRRKPVSLWMTLGSPLGEPAVQQSLYDYNEPEDGKYPTNIRRWVNISAYDDIVAADPDVRDDFQEVLRRGFATSIEDLPRIYNFWVGSDGSNPHKFYGYVNHPVFAAKLGEWVRS